MHIQNSKILLAPVVEQAGLSFTLLHNPKAYFLITGLKWAITWQNQQNDLCAQQRLRSSWASAQSDQSSLSAWRNVGPLAIHKVHSEDSDQTGQTPRLWVSLGAHIVVLHLKYHYHFQGAPPSDAPAVDTAEQVYISSLALLKVGPFHCKHRVEYRPSLLSTPLIPLYVHMLSWNFK